jgi:hypothetical protein
MGLICGELRRVWCGEVGGDRYGVDMRGVEKGIYPRSNMPRSFPKTKNKNKKCFFLKSQRCEHTPLKYSPTKKDDLARGLTSELSAVSSIINIGTSRTPRGIFSRQVWWRCEVRWSKWKLKSYSYVWGTRVFFSYIGKIKRIQVLRWRVSALMWAKLLKWNICTTKFSTFS